MLTLMRRHAKSWFIKIALGLIAIVFTFWGVGSYSERTANRVALVNGEMVTLAQYRETYTNLINQARQTFGEALNDDLVKRLKLREQAVERLVNQEVALQAAESAGVYIGDEIVLTLIQTDPAFRENDRFSATRYARVLGANNLSPQAYEATTRRAMAMERITGRLDLLSRVSDAEALAFYHWQRDEIRISYVSFEPSSFEGRVEPTEEDLTKFFEANKEAYRIPEKIVLEYLAFEPKNFLDQVRVDPAQINEIYEMTADTYLQPERIKIRDILLPLSDNAPDEEVAKVKAQAEELLAKALDGGDFKLLAIQYAPDAEQPEEVDWMSRDQLDPVLAEAAFGLAQGKLGGPLRTTVGYHVFKVEDKQLARQKTFEEVKPEIEAEQKAKQAKRLALEAAESAYGLSIDAQNMAELAKQLKMEAKTTEPFDRQTPPAGTLGDTKLVESAFELNQGEFGPAVELADGFYLIRVEKRLPSHLPEFKAVADKIKADYIQEEAKKKARAAAEEFLAKAKKDGWGEATKGAGFQVQLPPAFTRNSPVKDLGYDSQLNEAAFRLTPKKPLPEKIQEVGSKFAVIHFEDRLKADEEVFEKNKKDLIQAIRNQRRSELTEAWMNDIRARADVEIDPEAI